MNATVALLNAACGESDITFDNFDRVVNATLVDYDVTTGEFPEENDFDAIIITGSRASVYWDEQWIDNLKEWVAVEIENGTPILGICFGHQLVADVMGGKVIDRGGYEIGYHRISVTRESDIWFGMPSDFTAFTTHSDEVAELPEGASLIAENEYSIQGFESDNVVGLQFHPEYDRQMAEQLARDKDDLDADKRARVLSNITDEAVNRAKTAEQVFDNFIDRYVEI